MYRTVVVPFDRSDESVVAIAHGATVARQAGAELELLKIGRTDTIYEASPDNLGYSDNQQGISPGWAYGIGYEPEFPVLEATRRRGVDVRFRVAGSRDPATVIGEAAATLDTLVSLETRAHTPLGEITMGSVSERVVRSSQQPLLLVGPHCGPAPERYETIIAGCDGSELAEQILPTVIDWSIHLGLIPWLFQVLPVGVPPEGGTQDYFDGAYVQRMAENLRAKHHVKAEWDTAHARRPATAIARFAAGLPASVIALTMRGRLGYGRLVLGGVALSVARHATVPVLIQRTSA